MDRVYRDGSFNLEALFPVLSDAKLWRFLPLPFPNIWHQPFHHQNTFSCACDHRKELSWNRWFHASRNIGTTRWLCVHGLLVARAHTEDPNLIQSYPIYMRWPSDLAVPVPQQQGRIQFGMFQSAALCTFFSLGSTVAKSDSELPCPQLGEPVRLHKQCHHKASFFGLLATIILHSGVRGERSGWPKGTLHVQSQNLHVFSSKAVPEACYCCPRPNCYSCLKPTDVTDVPWFFFVGFAVNMCWSFKAAIEHIHSVWSLYARIQSHSLCQPQTMLEEIEGLISHLARGCPPKQTLWTRNRGESWMCFYCARHFRYARETSHAHGLEISDAASQSNHLQRNLESNPVLHSATRIVERSCLRFKPNPVKSSNSGGLLLTQAQLNFCSPRIRYEQVCAQAPCRAALFALWFKTIASRMHSGELARDILQAIQARSETDNKTIDLKKHSELGFTHPISTESQALWYAGLIRTATSSRKHPGCMHPEPRCPGSQPLGIEHRNLDKRNSCLCLGPDFRSKLPK